MKNVARVFVVAALLAGSLATAVPPAAAASDHCLDPWIMEPAPVPALGTVTIDGLDVSIDPNQADEDVDKVVALAIDVYWLVWCLEDGVVTGPYNCVAGRINEILATIDPANGNARYVTRDPNTGVVKFHGELLVSDAKACLPSLF